MTSPEVTLDHDEIHPGSSLGCIVRIVDKIREQETHRSNGHANAEARASFQRQINVLADQALPILRTADLAQIKDIQEYLGEQDPQIAIQVRIEIDRARRRSEPKIPRRRHRVPVPRNG